MARRGRYNTEGPLKGGIYQYQLANQAQSFTPAEARAEYARLRREANRRLEVLSRSDFAGSQTYRNWQAGFEALPRNASEREVRRELADVARFLNLRTSSLKGAKQSRRAFVETMQERGYDFITERNAADFGRFMGAVQQNKASKGYDSEQIVELYQTAKEKRIDTKTLANDFEFWLKNIDTLESAPRSSTTVSSADFAKKEGLTID